MIEPALPIAGLLRRCSPVVYANSAIPQVTGRGVVCDAAPGDTEFMPLMSRVEEP